VLLKKKKADKDAGGTKKKRPGFAGAQLLTKRLYHDSYIAVKRALNC